MEASIGSTPVLRRETGWPQDLGTSPARGPRRASAFTPWARSLIAARSSSVNPLDALPAVLLADSFVASRRARSNDLRHQLTQVVVGLIDHPLPQRSVAVAEQIPNALELGLAAELASMRRDARKQRVGQCPHTYARPLALASLPLGYPLRGPLRIWLYRPVRRDHRFDSGRRL
jgi:hypothetical protein